MAQDDLVKRLTGLLLQATARPWVAFDRSNILAIMKGRQPAKHRKWQEIIAWSGFDGADVPKPYRRANLHLIVEVVNALPKLLSRITQQQQRIAELTEALKLADALLSGANMNRSVVEKKVRAALGTET